MSDWEKEYEEKLAKKGAEIQEERAKIDAIVSGDFDDEYADVNKVTIRWESGDHKDWSVNELVLKNKEDEILLTMSDSSSWAAGQYFLDATSTHIKKTRENVGRLCLLCKEIKESAKYDREFDCYETIWTVKFSGEDGELVKSNLYTLRMAAIISEWVELPNILVSGIEDCQKYSPKEGLNFGHEEYNEEDEDDDEETLYKFSYVGDNEEQTWCWKKDRWDYDCIESELRKGDERHLKSAVVRDRLATAYQNATPLLCAWTEAAEEGKDESAPFQFNCKGKDYHAFKLEKKLLDLFNYFSPDALTAPRDLVHDGHDSVFVLAGEHVLADAYAGNTSIRYLKIVSDATKTIGARAFKGSTLQHVDLEPEFYSYNGTGNMPEIIGEDAFAGCHLENVFIQEGKVYIGNPLEYGYSLKIDTIATEEDKAKYPPIDLDVMMRDKTFVLEAVKKDGSALRHASDELKADKDVVLAALERWIGALQFAAPELLADREFMLEAVKIDSDALEFASPEPRADREVVLAAIEKSGASLKYAVEELQDDKEVVLAAVKNPDIFRSGPLQFASKRLRADKEVVLEAVKSRGAALEYASDALRADKDVVLAAVNCDGCALEYVSDELRVDKEFMLEVVKRNGNALRFASDELKADKEFMLDAVKQCGRVLEYASDELKADKEVVLAAVKQDGWALQYASDALRADKDVVLEAVKQDSWALKCASDALRADKEVVLEAVKQYGYALRFASKELQNDPELNMPIDDMPIDDMPVDDLPF